MEQDQKPKKNSSGLLRRLIIAVLLLIIIASALSLVKEWMDAAAQRRLEESLAQAASQTEAETTPPETEETEAETEAPYVSPIDFASLLETNPDTIGWIRVPDTKIDYPIVQSPDNQYYLHKDFEGKDSVYGTIYLDADSKPDFSGWNNPIYGHHMKDGSMFKDVVKFKDQDFFEAHRYFEIYTPERTIHLKTLGCYYSDSNGIVRKTSFKSQASFDKWVSERLALCSFAEVPEQPFDSMFVLVTCSYEQNDARTLLFAAEVDEDGNFLPATGRNVPEIGAEVTATTDAKTNAKTSAGANVKPTAATNAKTNAEADAKPTVTTDAKPNTKVK